MLATAYRATWRTYCRRDPALSLLHRAYPHPPNRRASSRRTRRAARADDAPRTGADQPADQPGTAPRNRARTRLDDYCVAVYPQYSKNLVQSWILQGKVTVNSRVVAKAGYSVPKDAVVAIDAQEPQYVCRAGYKLEAALQQFRVDVTGKVALDSGISTGGFTDCLLQHGAAQVFGVDVGYGQVALKVRNDSRVVLLERFNVRYLAPDDIGVQVDLVTLDLSFISVRKVLGAVLRVLRPGGAVLVLVKPQFEARRGEVKAGGVVKDTQVHQRIIAEISDDVCSRGFERRGVMESPLKGDKSGNTEYLAYFVHDPDKWELLHQGEGVRAVVQSNTGNESDA